MRWTRRKLATAAATFGLVLGVGGIAAACTGTFSRSASFTGYHDKGALGADESTTSTSVDADSTTTSTTAQPSTTTTVDDNGAGEVDDDTTTTTVGVTTTTIAGDDDDHMCHRGEVGAHRDGDKDGDHDGQLARDDHHFGGNRGPVRSRGHHWDRHR